jgi:hypothetical protein
MTFARKVVRRSRIYELRALSKLYGRRSHENLVQVLRHGNLSPFLIYLDMEICNGNLETKVLDSPLSVRYCISKLIEAR